MADLALSNPKARYFSEERGRDLRFSTPGNTRVYRINKLWELHHEICRRISLGEKNTEIAEALGVSVHMVSYTRNSKVAQDKIAILRGAMDADTVELGQRIQKFAPVALQFLENIINGEKIGDETPNIKMRARYADKHLERAGYGPVRKIASVSRHLTKDDIEDIKERSRKSAEEAGVIDINPETGEAEGAKDVK